MASFEHKYYLENPSLRARLVRNLSLIRSIVGHLIAWFTVGYRVRRACRIARQGGDKVYLEDHIGMGDS